MKISFNWMLHLGLIPLLGLMGETVINIVFILLVSQRKSEDMIFEITETFTQWFCCCSFSFPHVYHSGFHRNCFFHLVGFLFCFVFAVIQYFQSGNNFETQKYMNSNQNSANEGFLGRSLCRFLMVLTLQYIIYLLMATKYIYCL